MSTVLDAIRTAGTLHDWAATRPDAREFRGRAAAYAVAAGGDQWVVRHYRRGGMVARLLRDRYVRLGDARPLTELRASHAARDRGVPTPEIVAAVVYDDGALYRADLATRLIPGAKDLADAVLGPDRGDAGERVAAWRAAGSLLRRAFGAGVVHADINLRNILVQAGDSATPEAYLLDLDRAVVRDGAVDDVARRRMLERLHRSRRKLESASGVHATADELRAFAAGVTGA